MFNNKIWSSFGYLSVNELIQLDLRTVCQEISSGNETFMPGAPDNEKIYFFCVF